MPVYVLIKKGNGVSALIMKKRAIALISSILCYASFSGNLGAQTFVLADDTTIEGTITKATNNTIIIMEEAGMILPLSLTDIKEVRIPASQSDQTLSGQLIGWENGVFELRTPNYVLRVAEGRILSATDIEAGVGGPVKEDALPVQQDVPRQPAKADDGPTASDLVKQATM